LAAEGLQWAIGNGQSEITMLIFDQLKKNDPHLRAVTWGVLAGLGLLLAGLWWVQVFSYRHFAENQKAQSFRTVRIPAIRGKILDRHGAPLAENQPSYTVGVYLDELREHFKAEWARARPVKTNNGRRVYARMTRADRTALESSVRYRVTSNVVQTVGRLLQEPVSVGFEQFRRHYQEQLALPMPVLSGLSLEQIARFQERGVNPPGVDLEIQPMRFYPHGGTAAHLLGYLTKDNSSAEGEDADFSFRLPDYRGKIGIEGAFDPDLRGRAGVKSVLVNSLGYRQSEQIWSPAQPGRNVVLTLDLALQQEAEQALASLGPDTRGAIVVMDPTNGDLLALVSAPSFDPNRFIPRISREEFTRLNDPRLRPQINRALQENYAPGSIFKILTAIACLDAGLDPQEKIHNPGYIRIGRRVIDDLAPAGEYDFKLAFIKSSNTYFITNGLRAGIQNLVKIGTRLHLGERTRINTGQEVPGFFPTEKHVRAGWSSGDTANLCIGQGQLDVTPLQMAVMIAAVANGGRVLWPRLVARVEPADPNSDEPVIQYPPRPPRNNLGVRPRTLEIIREAMLADTTEKGGTAFDAFHESDKKTPVLKTMRVGGKTGTAQITDSRNRLIGHTLWFASFAPYENPRYVVLVMVESEGGGSGGGTCGPVAARIYRALERRGGTALAARTP
jgi:penicillin-binding protein 2